MPKLNSLEVVHQDTNADKFDNLHDLLVKFKKFYDESAGREIVDAEARAAYEALMEMYVNDKEAFAKRVETLSAKFGNSLAQVVEEMLAYASKSEAWAKKISTVEAELGNAKASIETETYARVTEDEALATQITTVEASVGANTAAITSEATARATADSALATQIDTVEARLDTGDFAAVKVESSATANKVSGIEAKWGVTTNVNGYVSGIQLLNGGSTSSSFTVDATKFVVKKPDGTNGIVWNGSASRLDVSGDIYANNFYGTGVVGTGNIAGNAVTNGASVSAGSSPTSVGITTSGGAVFVWASFSVPNSNTLGYTVYLTRDGSIISIKGYSDPNAQSDGFMNKIDYPSAGYHTYGISVTGDGPVYNIELMVLETKR